MNIYFFKNTGLLIMLTILISISQATVSFAFTIPQASFVGRATSKGPSIEPLFIAEETNGENSQVIELVDDDDDDDDDIQEQQQSNNNVVATTKTSEEKPATTAAAAVAPFLSQNEISEESMEINWNDPKQTRVMFYIILSLIPVLFLIPLMIGSRDLIPQDALPPIVL